MRKDTLIVGQELNKGFTRSKPFEKGNSAKRLLRWFNVSSYKELSKKHYIKNRFPEFKDKMIFYTFIYDNKIKKIILVGKKAQELFPYDTMMQIRKIENLVVCGILHPSGLNVNCNGKDEVILRLIKEVIKMKKESKQSILIRMLKKDFFTVEEIILKTGLKKSSVSNYTRYYLSKLGFKIEISQKNGQMSYKIV